MSRNETPENRNLLTQAEETVNRLLSKLSGWSLTKIIVVGLIPRLLLMPFVAHPFDVQAWYLICEWFTGGNFSFSAVLASLRPLWVLTLVPIVHMYNFLSSITGLSAIPVASLSLIAFVYAQKNFPYYLLPIATINQGLLTPLFKLAEPFGQVVQNALMPTALGAIVLAALGVGFSVLLVKAYVKVIRILRRTSGS